MDERTAGGEGPSKYTTLIPPDSAGRGSAFQDWAGYGGFGGFIDTQEPRTPAYEDTVNAVADTLDKDDFRDPRYLQIIRDMAQANGIPVENAWWDVMDDPDAHAKAWKPNHPGFSYDWAHTTDSPFHDGYNELERNRVKVTPPAPPPPARTQLGPSKNRAWNTDEKLEWVKQHVGAIEVTAFDHEMDVDKQVRRARDRAEEARSRGNHEFADYLDDAAAIMARDAEGGRPEPWSHYWPMALEEFGDDYPEVVANPSPRRQGAAWQAYDDPDPDNEPNDFWAEQGAPETTEGPWWHASLMQYQPGDIIMPNGGKHPSRNSDMYSADHLQNRLNWVWMDRPQNGRSTWAQPDDNVYEVEPLDEGPHPWNGDASEGYASPRARVKRVIQQAGSTPRRKGGIVAHREQVALHYRAFAPPPADVGPPKMDWNKVMDSIKDTGGYTIGDAGEAPSSGYMISQPGTEERRPTDTVTPHTEEDYHKRHWDELAADPDTHQGGWGDKDTFYTDISRNDPNLWRTIGDAVTTDQLGVYDLNHHRTLDTSDDPDTDRDDYNPLLTGPGFVASRQLTAEVAAWGRDVNDQDDHSTRERDPYGFAGQASQYAPKGPPGINHEFHDVEGIPINVLLHRGDNGKVLGILNHFPKGTPYGDDPGDITVMVHPKHQEKGIGSALTNEAVKRWDVNLDDQKYTSAGSNMFDSIVRNRKSAGMDTMPGKTTQQRRDMWHNMGDWALQEAETNGFDHVDGDEIFADDPHALILAEGARIAGPLQYQDQHSEAQYPTPPVDLPERRRRSLEKKFKQPTPALDPNATDDRIDIDNLVKNALSRYQGATDEQRETGRNWYADARRKLQGLVQATGGDFSKAAAIMAALSPQMDWEGNLNSGAHFLNSYNPAEKSKWRMPNLSPAAYKAWSAASGNRAPQTPEEWSALAGMAGTSDPDWAKEMAMDGRWDRAVGQATNKKYRHRNDYTGTGLPALGDNVLRAMNVYDSPDPRQVMQYAAGPKIHSFWRNFLGDEDYVTIDKHMLRALDRPFGSDPLMSYGSGKPEVTRQMTPEDRRVNELEKQLSYKRTQKGDEQTTVPTGYNSYTEAIRRATAQVNAAQPDTTKHLTPAQMQAIIWVQHKGDMDAFAKRKGQEAWDARNPGKLKPEPKPYTPALPIQPVPDYTKDNAWHQQNPYKGGDPRPLPVHHTGPSMSPDNIPDVDVEPDMTYVPRAAMIGVPW